MFRDGQVKNGLLWLVLELSLEADKSRVTSKFPYRLMPPAASAVRTSSVGESGVCRCARGSDVATEKVKFPRRLENLPKLSPKIDDHINGIMLNGQK